MSAAPGERLRGTRDVVRIDPIKIEIPADPVDGKAVLKKEAGTSTAYYSTTPPKI